MTQLSFFSEENTKTYRPYTPIPSNAPKFPNPRLKRYNKDAEDLNEKYYGRSFESVHGKYPIFNIWYSCYANEAVKLYVQMGMLGNIIGVQIFSSRQHFEDYFHAYQ